MSVSGLTQNLRFQIRAARLPEPQAELRFAPPRRWRLDLAWVDRKLAVEVDGGTWIGGRHTRGKGFESDCQKLNQAALAGWRVFRFTGGMVKSGEALDTLRAALEQADEASGGFAALRGSLPDEPGTEADVDAALREIR